MKKITMQLKSSSYTIWIRDDILFHLSFYIKEIYQGKKVYIITDDIVEGLYLKRVIDSLSELYTVEYVVIPNGESSKGIETYTYILEELLKKNIRRNELLIALGGGVVGDITGFVSATIFRGVPYVNIPTTLLSQMDSSIGGKTGIDFLNRKNVIGCFKQPSLVLIDPKTLHTLPLEEYKNGLGELIKHAVIGDKKLLDKLYQKSNINEEIIYQSLLVKKRVVEMDEFDMKERMFLNFGHTFGHVIELKYQLKHGIAVILGMLMAIQLGIDLKVTNPVVYDKVEALLKLYDLPYERYNYKEYLEDIVRDKKNLAGRLNLVLVKNIGEPILYPLEENKIKELL